MANRNKGGRATLAQAASLARRAPAERRGRAARAPRAKRRRTPSGRAARGRASPPRPGSVLTRPRWRSASARSAPWHPLPLSELLILIGAIGTVVGLLARGIRPGAA